MKTWIKSLHALLLAGLIAVTSVSMSLARGQMRDASGTMVLCTGTGPMTVQLDSQGEPIGPMPICPDCAVSFLDHVGIEPLILIPSTMRFLGWFDFDEPDWNSHSRIWKQARGPPLL